MDRTLDSGCLAPSSCSSRDHRPSCCLWLRSINALFLCNNNLCSIYPPRLPLEDHLGLWGEQRSSDVILQRHDFVHVSPKQLLHFLRKKKTPLKTCHQQTMEIRVQERSPLPALSNRGLAGGNRTQSNEATPRTNLPYSLRCFKR